MMTAKRTEHPRVLVVEDDDAVGKVLRLSLRRGGFDTAEAESGGEALRIMERSTFEAVVLDLCLPDGLGGAVLQQLQDVPPGGHPVWVAMSALDEDEAIETLRSAARAVPGEAVRPPRAYGHADGAAVRARAVTLVA